jgi:hypothetical protein
MKILEHLKTISKNDGPLCGKCPTSHKTIAKVLQYGQCFCFHFLGWGCVMPLHTVVWFSHQRDETRFHHVTKLENICCPLLHTTPETVVKTDISAPLLANEKPSRHKFSCISNLHNLLDTWCSTPVSDVITLIATCRYSLCWTQQFYFLTLGRGR